MPGLAGLLVKSKTGQEEELLSTMVGCVLHEHFYTHGSFKSPEHGFFVGYTAVKGSFADCMPIFNEKKDLVLFLTGECYTDPSVIRELETRRHVFNANEKG